MPEAHPKVVSDVVAVKRIKLKLVVFQLQQQVIQQSVFQPDGMINTQFRFVKTGNQLPGVAHKNIPHQVFPQRYFRTLQQ